MKTEPIQIQKPIKDNIQAIAQLLGYPTSYLPTEIVTEIIKATTEVEIKNKENEMVFQIGEVADLFKKKEVLDNMEEIKKVFEDLTENLAEFAEKQKAHDRAIEQVQDEVYELREG